MAYKGVSEFNLTNYAKFVKLGKFSSPSFVTIRRPLRAFFLMSFVTFSWGPVFRM